MDNSTVVAPKQAVPDEYTTADIEAALKEDEGDGGTDRDLPQAKSKTQYRNTSGIGIGLNGRGHRPLVMDGTPLADKPAHNACWGGRDELPEWFGKNYKQEKYEHRLMAFMKAQGMSNVEISQRSGYSYGAVCQIMHLPWVVAVITEEIARSGRDAVQEVLQSTAMDTVQFLIRARDDEKAQMRDRITCGKELLDRIYGKPNQPITHKEAVDLDSLTNEQLGQIIKQASNQPN